MRWFVEISALGAKSGPSTKLCIEAPQWQPALQKARATRGDSGALANFSIELLEDGFRAIDPMARLRYLVKRAPDDAPLTDGSPAPAAAKAQEAKAPDAKAQEAKAPAAKAPDAKAPDAKAPDAKAPDAKAPDAKAPEAKAPAAKVPEAKAQEAKAPEAKATVRQPAPVTPSAPATSGAVGRGASAEPIPLVVKAHAPAAAKPPLPSFELLFKREDDPSERSPLHYREQVYAVAPGTHEDEAQRLILDRLEVVRESLAQARPGKLVNLAVFDHVFKGRPQRSPLVTLSWKDWKSDPPELRFPARDGTRDSGAPASHAGPAPASAPSATSAAAPVAASASASATAPVRAQATLTSEESKVAPHKEPAASVAVVAASKPAEIKAPAPQVIAPMPVVPVGAAASPAPAAGGTPAPQTPVVATRPSPGEQVREAEAAFPLAAAKPSAGISPAAVSVSNKVTTPAAPEAKPAPVVAAQTKSAPEAKPAPVVAAQTKSAPEAKPAPVVAAQTKSAPEAKPAPVVAAQTKSAPAAAPGKGGIVKPAAPPRPTPHDKPAAPPKPEKRLSGDDLLSELFESFGDLHFLRDSLAGAEFVLALTLEKLPSEVGLVSFFDMNKREFVVVRQAGSGRSALCLRQPEKAALAAEAMRKRHAVVVNERGALERATDDRWKAVGVELGSLMCAPVELNGRYLGLIELGNPLDGSSFNEGDGNALTYIGQQFAEFVASHGVAIDPEQIRASEQAAETAPPRPEKPGPTKASAPLPPRRN